ncbi:MAG: hypothetical protein NXY57DRAFT_1028916 [Lentinula lateritia]|nr:MAG: hypothetical protein NXY57DRAFT_1028916 [Lentinula lateritia]
MATILLVIFFGDTCFVHCMHNCLQLICLFLCFAVIAKKNPDNFMTWPMLSIVPKDRYLVDHLCMHLGEGKNP